MNEETRKVLERLERMTQKDSLPSIGPVKGKVIADVIQIINQAGFLKLEHYMDILQYLWP
jgi:hypothetical protein